jgi:hypothetical protein
VVPPFVSDEPCMPITEDGNGTVVNGSLMAHDPTYLEPIYLTSPTDGATVNLWLLCVFSRNLTALFVITGPVESYGAAQGTGEVILASHRSGSTTGCEPD